MNRLTATITGYESSAHTSLLTLDSGGNAFFVLLLDTPHTATQIKKGHTVGLLFKETEITVSPTPLITASFLNTGQSRLKKQRIGRLLSELELSYQTQIIRVILPTQAVKRLDFHPQDTVYWYVKSNDIIVQWSLL